MILRRSGADVVSQHILPGYLRCFLQTHLLLFLSSFIFTEVHSIMAITQAAHKIHEGSALPAVIDAMQRIAPLDLADSSWDNVGLLLGRDAFF